MGVRAKFYIQAVTDNISGGSVELQPVCRGDENKSWSKATPAGSLKMSIINEPALAFFRQLLADAREGKCKPEVFIDISVATDDLA